MVNDEVHEIVKSNLIRPENYIYGFADLTGLLVPEFDGLSFGISVGRRLSDKIVNGITRAPTLEYLAHYLEINEELQATGHRIADALIHTGARALAVKTTVAGDPASFDRMLPDLRYDISHKMVATRAGLGWIGKTDLFISRQFGPRLRLTSILTDKVLVPESPPINKSRCGKCEICVVKCPAKAANGRPWDIGTDRDLFFDAFRCREQCSEFGRSYLGIDKRICGICVAVCPVGQIKGSTESLR